MEKPQYVQLYFTLLSAALFFAAPVQAMVGSKLDVDSLSSAESAAVQNFINTEVRADLADHFEDKLKKIALKDSDAPMSPESEAVLLKGVYAALSQKSPIPISEALF